MFTDSIDGNLETIRELLAGIPPSEQQRCKWAALLVEKTVVALQKDNPKSAAVALGTAYALFLLSQRIVNAPKNGDKDKGMIELLS
jgi:hypothetical protein